MGPSLGTSLGLSSAVADPRPVAPPHLLSCGTVLYGPGPPYPSVIWSLSNGWRQAQVVTGKVAPLRGTVKISPPYRSGPSARRSCWWTLGYRGTQPPSALAILSYMALLVWEVVWWRVWCFLVSWADELTRWGHAWVHPDKKNICVHTDIF